MCGLIRTRRGGLTMTTISEYLAEDPWLAAVFESSNDAIITNDSNGVTTSWNGAAERLFGYSAAEVIGQPVFFTFQPHRVDEENVLLDRIGRGELVDHYETERRHKNGRIIKVSVTISCIRDASRMIVGSSTILRDLSDRNDRDQHIHELETEIVRLQRLAEVDHVVSALIHEVSQPLTAIRNYANACRRLATIAGQERIQAALECIVDQTNRTWEIVQRIRGLVIKGDVQMRVGNLSQVMKDTIAIARSSTKDEGLAITTQFDSPLFGDEINKL